MILTFSRAKYNQLLCQYQPKVIRSEAENEAALEIIEQLMHLDNRTPEENELYDLLAILVEKFEQEHYKPGITSTPHSILIFLMEQQEILLEDLTEVLGSQEIAKKIINGELKINSDLATVLSDLFNVDSNLFLE